MAMMKWQYLNDNYIAMIKWQLGNDKKIEKKTKKMWMSVAKEWSDNMSKNLI